MSSMNLHVETGPVPDLQEVAAELEFEGHDLIEEIQKVVVNEVREDLLKSTASYRGFSSTNDPEFEAMHSRLTAGLDTTILLKEQYKTVMGRATLIFEKENNCLRVEGEDLLGWELPMGSLSGVCRGTDAMLSLRKSYRDEDLKRSVSLVFNRPSAAHQPFKGGLRLRVHDKHNVELDLKFATADDAEAVARFFETVSRDTALANIASRHVTYFPPAGQPSAAKLSKKIHQQHMHEHRLHQASDPEASKREIARVQAVRQKEIAACGYPELNAEFKAALAKLQAGVSFVAHQFNGVARSWFSTKQTRGVLLYDRDHVVHIHQDVDAAMLFCGLGGEAAGKGSEKVYGVAEVQAISLGDPLPTRMMLRHVPHDALPRTVSMVFNTSQAVMTFATVELAHMVTKFFNTVIWHREQQFLDSSRVFLLNLKDKVEMGGHVESAEQATDAPVA